MAVRVRGTISYGQSTGESVFAGFYQPTLIQGPPGTGKTATAAWIVDAFAEIGENIVLTSGSNAAIDNVAKKYTVT